MNTGIIKGDDVLLYVGVDAIAHSTNHSLDLGTSTIDTTSKDAAGWEKHILGTKKWSMSMDAMVAYDAAYGFNDLVDLWLAGTPVVLKFSTEVTGDTYFTGTASIESINKVAGQGDKVTFSVSFKGNGPLTKAVVAA